MNSNKTILWGVIGIAVLVGAYFIIRATGTDQSAAVYRAPRLSRNCVQANPTVTLTPPANTTVATGSTISYQVTVKNNDSSRCGKSMFNTFIFKSATSPEPLYGSNATDASAWIEPGATYSKSITVTPNDVLVPGNYTFVYRAINSAYPDYYGNSEPVPLTVVAQ